MYNLPTPDGHSNSFTTSHSWVVQAVIQVSHRRTTGHYRRTEASHSDFTKWAFIGSKRASLTTKHSYMRRISTGSLIISRYSYNWKTRGYSTRTVVQTATQRSATSATASLHDGHTQLANQTLHRLHTTRHRQTSQLLSLAHPYTYKCSLNYEKRRAGHSKRAEKQIKAGGQHANQDEQEDAHER